MKLHILNARLSFANLVTPYKPKDGDPKYRANFICSDETKIRVEINGEQKTLPHPKAIKVIEKIAKDKFGKVPAKLYNYVYNCADGSMTREEYMDDEGNYYEGYDEDTYYFTGATKVDDTPNGVTIVDQKRRPLDASKGHPVSGDYVNAVISLFAFEYEGKKGVSAGLEGIQYKAKGEPFGKGQFDPSSFDEEEMEDDDYESEMEDDDDLF